jgi:CRP/FNR family transcriptional regulator, cyclic AMP receptor protein
MEPVILPGDTGYTMSEDDFDFTRPQEGKASAPFKAASSRFYNSGAAEMLFRASGREEKFGNNQVLFLEAEKVTKGGLFKAPSRMYFVASGEVLLTMGPRPLDTVKKGEIFGEMAVISGRPRSASATARGDVVTFSMDADELQAAIGRNPEFALMLASVMYDRLRFIATRLAQKKMEPGSLAREATVFEPALMAQLIAGLPEGAIVRYPRETIIFKEGQAGTFMYMVKSGRIAIAVGSNIVEVVGAGGTFGEMAIVDQSPRTARAGALEDSELVSIDRDVLMGLIKKNPAFAMAMLRGIADRLRHMNSLL